MYTLGGIANPETGWGVAGETWTFLDQIARLGGPHGSASATATSHPYPTRRRVARRRPAPDITADLCRRLRHRRAGAAMSDDAVRTIVHSAEGDLAFQEYFVGRHCDVPVTGFAFAGIERRPADGRGDGDAALSRP